KQHQRGNYHASLTYYNRIINEELVKISIQNLANNYYILANNQKKLPSVNEYYQRTVNASSVTERWDAALHGLVVYPNNQKILNALNEAANRNLIQGKKQQMNGNISSARTYYNKVAIESNVSESIRTLAKVFLNQLSVDYRPVVYIDAGHGGSDPGAKSRGVSEKQLTLTTSNYLKSELEARGYLVLMSRTSDKYIE